VVSEKVAANEEIRETQLRLGLGGAHLLPFLCECDDVRCRSLVRLSPHEYADARAVPSRQIVLEGHAYDGKIVARGSGYVVAEA
jgi:hypothetical protein